MPVGPLSAAMLTLVFYAGAEAEGDASAVGAGSTFFAQPAKPKTATASAKISASVLFIITKLL